MPEPAHDALEALRARLEETRLHAERLADEAAQARRAAEARDRAAGGPPPDADRDGPPAGEAPGGSPGSGPAAAIDLQAIAALLETLRELVPPELQQQLADVTRQVLLLLRALIDWWVDRLEEPAAGPAGADHSGPAVRDIPVR